MRELQKCSGWGQLVVGWMTEHCGLLSPLRQVQGLVVSGKDQGASFVQLMGTLGCSAPKHGSRQRNGCLIVKDRLRFVNEE